MTALELIISVAVLGTLGLVLLGLLRASILSSGRSSEQAFILSIGRKALGGSGSFSGILWACRQAAGVKSLEPNALVLATPESSRLTYTLSPQGELRFDRHEAGSSKLETPAKGLAGLAFRYYSRGPDYRVIESTSAEAASLVLVSLEVPAKTRTLRLLSGARLMNHP